MKTAKPEQPRAFMVYRKEGKTLRQRVQGALEMYTRVYKNGYPPAIVVHPREVEAARRIVSDLGLNIEVKAVGGCLVPEVWLMIDETSVHKTRGRRS